MTALLRISWNTPDLHISLPSAWRRSQNRGPPAKRFYLCIFLSCIFAEMMLDLYKKFDRTSLGSDDRSGRTKIITTHDDVVQHGNWGKIVALTVKKIFEVLHFNGENLPNWV